MGTGLTLAGIAIVAAAVVSLKKIKTALSVKNADKAFWRLQFSVICCTIESVKHLFKGLTGDIMAENNSLNIYKSEDEVWNKIAEMQDEVFKTSGRNGKGGVEFTYRIKKDKNGSWCGEMFVSTKEKSITRSTVMQAYRKALELGGIVTGPKKLGTFGASYLYSIFIKLEIIKQEE